MRSTIKKSLAGACVLATLLAASTAHAEQTGGFGDVSVNYLDWNHTPGMSNGRSNDAYLELEGGGQYTWGELYGFTDWNHFNKASDEYGMFAKGQLRYYLGDERHGAGWNAFFQSKIVADHNFHEFNQVVGVGYNVALNNASFTPFIGAHYTNSTYFAGWNGYELGWAAWVPFNLGSQSFALTNWSEFDFNRKEAYIPQGSSRQSFYGVLALWWNVTPHWSVGGQYNYAVNTLGADGLTDAYIATAKYNF
ncbi:hypothetical protein HNQ50_002009 [Silvimonas terrae]|uniref:Nucleoside-specific channel-forming protein Tsx n=1 Tax=Silvimonas terrae TaxID=300266 RepID=A0A840RG07_9NEIS|nr:outer membrane protein OmpK [Silvimonas terrae]MBB5191286.1 hypothetical protein [Silvimonas terrae]